MVNTTRKKSLLFLVILYPICLITQQVKAGSFGAEIFCTMRNGGNAHESSWEAAYSYIKKQKGGFFKVSPKQAAAQIVETVVRERDKFDYCVEYLEQLHPDRKLIRELEKKEQQKRKETKAREERRKQLKKELEETDGEFSPETLDRYSY
mgnify:CR=1 FL=1